MAKKDREKFFERVRADAERFCPDLDALTTSEVNDLLSAAGADIELLRKRLNESVKNLVVAQRLKGNKVPGYLQDVLDMTSANDEPAKNPKIAIEKATRWLNGFVDKVIPPPNRIVVQRAYRKTGSLSGKDANLLDQLEEKLKNSVKKENA
jgi:hypothetical protein